MRHTDPYRDFAPAGNLAERLGPDPEPLDSERFERALSAERSRRCRSSGRSAALASSGAKPCGARAHLPAPGYVASEPSLLEPYLTDARHLLRIIGRAPLGSEMVLLLEDCRTLTVELCTWHELAGHVRAVKPAGG